jgi:hypothetical protein
MSTPTMPADARPPTTSSEVPSVRSKRASIFTVAPSADVTCAASRMPSRASCTICTTSFATPATRHRFAQVHLHLQRGRQVARQPALVQLLLGLQDMRQADQRERGVHRRT